MIIYQESVNNINPDEFTGFFVGWNEHPDSEKLFEILKNSKHKIIAVDDENKKAVGFIYAISDGSLSAYIPLLEVLPEYQDRGIGSELVKRMMDKLESYYMIDIVCDESLQGFYEKFGMKKYSSMIKRNYDKQRGITK